MRLQGKTVVLCVTGGIAAYKAADMVSRLRKLEAEVHVIMTASACEFITPLTFEVLSGNRVVTDMFDRAFTWEVEHISLAKKADIFVIAPATANIIAKAAHGIADDMTTTTLLATKAPVLLAPAMNTGMYTNPITQENMQKLRNFGMHFVDPISGHLACGDTGAGKLADPAVIVDAICNLLTPKDLSGVRLLLTAGPTQEAMDPVRYLTNHSTGKMGYAIAALAHARGAQVTLVSGPVNLPVPNGVTWVPITSAQDMYDAVLTALPAHDWVIKAAAVGDYRPITRAEDKLKKGDGDLSIPLTRNPDILAAVGEQKRTNQLVCGFSMETKDLLENSAAKMRKKKCDMMVANNLKQAGAGFGHDTNVVTLLYPDGSSESLDLMQKTDLAGILLDRMLQRYQK